MLGDFVFARPASSPTRDGDRARLVPDLQHTFPVRQSADRAKDLTVCVSVHDRRSGARGQASSQRARPPSFAAVCFAQMHRRRDAWPVQAPTRRGALRQGTTRRRWSAPPRPTTRLCDRTAPMRAVSAREWPRTRAPSRRPLRTRASMVSCDRPAGVDTTVFSPNFVIADLRDRLP